MQNREEQTREIDVQVQVPGSRQADCGFKAHHRTRTDSSELGTSCMPLFLICFAAIKLRIAQKSKRNPHGPAREDARHEGQGRKYVVE